jgi:glutamate-1-semialdehyde 2,1-aminomutase
MDPARIAALTERENRRFVEEHPKSLELHRRARQSMPNGYPMGWGPDMYAHGPIFVESGEGAHFTDVDGHRYVDFNLADMSLFCGFAPEPVARAVAERAAAGPQFLLPNEDAIVVAEELARRYRLPAWQFTLSATTANVEAMRVARAATGRSVVLFFEGRYHGHADEMLFGPSVGGLLEAEYLGLDPAVGQRVRVVEFNDWLALRNALKSGDVACVVTEPAMTNCGVIMPEQGFHEELRRQTRQYGTLLVIDETHTQVCGPGGLTGQWNLEPDLITLGKSIAGGVPLGAYGMTRELAELFERPDPTDPHAQIATGGTLFGNALSMAAARAALTEVLTDDVYPRTAAIGEAFAGGINDMAWDSDIDWGADQLFPRVNYFFGHRPGWYKEYLAQERRDFVDLKRVYLANRGVWEAIYSAGPCVGVAHTRDDVGTYLKAVRELLEELGYQFS